MANIKKKKKNNTNHNGYFAKNIRENGPSFMVKKTANDIRHEYKQIFKDIAFSSPDKLSHMVPYFMSSSFVYNLSMCAFQEQSKNNAIALGLNTHIQTVMSTNGLIDPNMRLEEALIDAQQSATAYGIISTHLNNIINLISYGYDNEDWMKMNIDSQLQSMCIQLSNYKKSI